jgi:hypothetical protein
MRRGVVATLCAGFIALLTAGAAVAMQHVSLPAWQTSAAVISVPDGGDLQEAINRARPGDVILLTAGATYVGNFALPVKTGDEFITIRTGGDGASLPPEGTRITPAHAPWLAKLKSPNSLPVLRTQPRAHHWRLQWLEFLPNTNPNGDIITLGDGSSAQARLEDVPHHLVIDRCYIHGDPVRGQKRGVALNSASTTIQNSHISEIKAVGMDTQAIGGWNGPGPYWIENNRLEAAGEVFMLGGATPGIHGLIPSDVVFVRNHVTRPEAWRSEKWTVKNLFELKNARRVLIANNLFERHWVNAQAGYAIVFTPRGERGRAAWATVEDVTFRRNVVRDVAAGINLLGHDSGGPSGLLKRIHITENLFYRFDRDQWQGNGFFLLIGQGPTNIVIERNTILQRGNLIQAYGRERGSAIPISSFVFRNNIALHNRYGVHGDGHGVGRDTLNSYFPDATFEYNVIAGANPSAYPSPNFFPSDADLMSQFVDPQNDDFRLKPGSRYLTAGSDGGPIGAPVALLREGLEKIDPCLRLMGGLGPVTVHDRLRCPHMLRRDTQGAAPPRF